MHYYLARGNVFNGNALEITEIGMLSRSVALLGLVDVSVFYRAQPVFRPCSFILSFLSFSRSNKPIISRHSSK